MNTIKVENNLRKDFINGLIEFSNAQISITEAELIADTRLRTTDFSDDSPLAHKGPYWLAKAVLRTMGIIQ